MNNFEIDKKVKIPSGTEGIITGVVNYKYHSTQYQVQYNSATGAVNNDWFTAEQLELI